MGCVCPAPSVKEKYSNINNEGKITACQTKDSPVQQNTIFSIDSLFSYGCLSLYRYFSSVTRTATTKRIEKERERGEECKEEV